MLYKFTQLQRENYAQFIFSIDKFRIAFGYEVHAIKL